VRVVPMARGVALLLVLGFATGCQNVEPWQRGQLSAPRMQSEPHPAHAGLLDHVRQSRESATTGNGSGGGGCGCY
jgi:hypothetical protein